MLNRVEDDDDDAGGTLQRASFVPAARVPTDAQEDDDDDAGGTLQRPSFVPAARVPTDAHHLTHRCLLSVSYTHLTLPTILRV